MMPYMSENLGKALKRGQIVQTVSYTHIGSANAALEFRRFVGDDVAVEVRQHKYLEVAAAFFVDQLCSGDINIPVCLLYTSRCV